VEKLIRIGTKNFGNDFIDYRNLSTSQQVMKEQKKAFPHKLFYL
jgi:hypothetical protein